VAALEAKALTLTLRERGKLVSCSASASSPGSGTVSVRTLRHYDEIGLLRPAKVDPETGYRGYSAEQLGRLNRIIALKELGPSLAQTRQLLDGITLDELRGMLMLRRAPERALRRTAARAWLKLKHGVGRA
jgi:DNA-binding transcriptional MerR regulator